MIKKPSKKTVIWVGTIIMMVWHTAAFPIPAIYGKLKVVNNKLCSSTGVPVQLKGMSTHGLQWFGGFMTSGVVGTLKNDWKATVFRAAMYIDEGGYAKNSSVKQKVIDCINFCGDHGIYCIIDWHILNPGDPNVHMNLAKAFFKEMATNFGTRDNIIYELCNEPNGVSWSAVKSYADTIINVIRPIDPNTVIIVGTPNWSQYVDKAAESPLNYPNIMYALHFYAGTHSQSLRDLASNALKKIPIYLTEWGTSKSDGVTGFYKSESQKWLDWADSNCISWCNWVLSDGGGTSSALVKGASKEGGWTASWLTESGQFVREAIRKPPVTTVAPFKGPVSYMSVMNDDKSIIPCYTLIGRRLETNYGSVAISKVARDRFGNSARIVVNAGGWE